MATCLGIDVYMTLGQIDRAVAIGLDYLRHLGIDWPVHPTEEQVRSEYERDLVTTRKSRDRGDY